jgi:pimeloyl-ACP methyl ester carboxylesterase
MANASAFRIQVEQEVLDDLHQRLIRTRWPDEPAGAGWEYGTNLAYLKELVHYWIHQYDWRKHEATLNAFNHYTASIHGTKVHFIHQRGKGPNPLPIILTHGWPDSFYRFHKIIPLLTDPEKYGSSAADSFDVIVPSVPGFGFSQRSAMTNGAVADLWAGLMTQVLGYKYFAAAGGDVGSGVTQALALQHPEVVRAIHLTDVGYPTGQEDFSMMTEAEREFAGFVQGWWFREGAYAMVQMTKPQSLAFSLNDSPVGWAAWVLSFGSAGASGNDVEGAFGGRDELLTNLMIYWVTQTAGSSARMYLENARASYAPASGTGSQGVGGRSSVPAAVALFPGEAQFPREWAERSVNLQRFTAMPRGGHFSPMEVPDLFTEDLRAFFRGYRE